jgi:uncharacterized protein (DUF697 family)
MSETENTEQTEQIEQAEQTEDKAELSKLDQAREIARGKAYWAAGIGIIPVPIIDVAGIAAVQLRMIHEIAGVYDTKLSDHLAKSILTSLLTGVGATAAAYGALGYTLKSVPLLGPLLGVAAMPATAGATTYAVGVVFATAFEQNDPSLVDGNEASTREALDDAIRNNPITA